jgi:putative ABC transport system ATP-binding protein
MRIIKTTNLFKSYKSGDGFIRVIDDVSFSIAQGEFVAVMGRSGCGKTTLLNLIGGLDEPEGGDVAISGQNLFGMDDEARSAFRRQNIGFIFQNYNLLPMLNVRDNISLPVGLDHKRLDTSFFGQVTETLGLADKLNRYPRQLSGGEQQRVAIARAVIHRPDLVLADEPTGNLDTDTGAEVLDLLFAVSRPIGQTAIIVTHDKSIAERADRVLLMSDGRLADG